MKILPISIFVFSFLIQEVQAQQYPSCTIENGLITAKLYLPNNDEGFYKSTRFDWSGIIYELKYKGHDYFGKWYPIHNPETTDAICGPVEEFSEIGYNEANSHEEFLKIGVGGLRKPKERGYNKFKFYKITNPGEWTISKTENKIVFTHTVNNVSGYSYKYTKIVELLKDKPELIIKHILENTGEKSISTEVYNHNFLTIDFQPTSPDIIVRFSEDLKIKIGNNLMYTKKKEIRFKREFTSNENVMITNAIKEKGTNTVNDIIVENKKTKAGVKITSESVYSQINFWASQNTYCPEPYINIEIPSQKDFKWGFTYKFYLMY